MASAKRYHLPWNEGERYWLILVLPEEAGSTGDGLTDVGFSPLSGLGRAYLATSGRQWGKEWGRLYAWLNERQLAETAQASIIGAEQQPTIDEINVQLKPAKVIDQIAQNLWLGEAMLENRLLCYMQSVVDKRGVIFGHESFVRMHQADGEMVSGAKIIAAAKALSLQHALDRYLHVLAVKSFTSSSLTGNLFVNFISGFIQRPAIYLEGLTDAIQRYQMPAKNIVLDFTKAETLRDLQQMKNIVEYGRSKGFLIALDDIESLGAADVLVAGIRPDFVKLDIALVRQSIAGGDMKRITQLVELAHQNGGMAIAEGVETKEAYDALMAVGVDLFQGYYFSKPAEAKQADQRSIG